MPEKDREFCFVVTEEIEGERVDKCLNGLMESQSRSYIQKLLGEGRVTVNGRQVKASYRVNVEDQLKINLPPAIMPDILPENISLSVLYEDGDVIVVNKPKGMVVHPAPGHYSGTLVNALLFHCRGNLSGINGILRPGIVHRIDRDTTGSLIACKNDLAHASIARQLKEHTIVRRYHAIVCGRIREEKGELHTQIGRHPTDRKKMTVLARGGKEAITHYRVLAHLKNYTYIECALETGRTHQIRVHMAHLGHPILGDGVYGPKNCPFHLEGQTLHAKILGFHHPADGKYIETDAPLPEYFERLLHIL
ncbi:ribosomal large subunit pseudouridine synthase D [Lachnospiraceae bacterium]|nr:ribosomal large subunit pseudouridine synthase D [Lachnospiraceae bacterium]